jgi:uncharacterized membrane protein (UPF0127 family)
VVKNANPVWGWLSWSKIVCAIAIAFAVSACDRDKDAATDKIKTVSDRFDLRVGEKLVHLQIAVSTLEMERGLMERRDLGADEGMLFAYTSPQQMSYWMRNTPTPLDIGFFDRSGVLQEVYPLHPFDETSLKSRSESLQYAVELRQGWFHDNDVRSGAQLDLKALARALKARGYEPEKFGLKLE